MNSRIHQKKKTLNDPNKIDLRNEIQAKYGDHPVPWFKWVFNFLDIPKSGRLLELGCGSGALWRENQKRIPESSALYLSDLSPEIVQQSKNNLSGLHSKPYFLDINSQSLPFNEETFDAVLAIGLLDLVPNLHNALSESWRVLRPSGLLFASAGGKGHLQEMTELLRPYLSDDPKKVLGGNEEYFGLENGERILSSYFEEVIRHDYLASMSFTSLQPILNYVLSEQAVLWSLPVNKMGPFVQQLKRDLARRGEIRVTIQKGLFIAKKKVANLE